MSEVARTIAPFLDFAALLRRSAFSVAPEQIMAWLAAIELLGPTGIGDIRRSAHAILAPPPERFAEFDALFDESGHWRDKPSEIPDPARLAEQGAFLDAVQMCIDKLPKRIGQVFVLREVLGTDTKEICKDLDLTSSNVWVQLYRARMMLRMCLERGGFGRASAG